MLSFSDFFSPYILNVGKLQKHPFPLCEIKKKFRFKKLIIKKAIFKKRMCNKLLYSYKK